MKITERLHQLSTAVADQNWREFSMRVPAEPDRDADIVIMQAAMLIESRDAEVVSLTNQRDYEYVRAENAEQERDQLREQVTLLRNEVIRCRDWFETQAKVTSKGGPSSWELMLLRNESYAAEEALAATEPKP